MMLKCMNLAAVLTAGAVLIVAIAGSAIAEKKADTSGLPPSKHASNNPIDDTVDPD